jgi:hypothetical protein
MFLLFKSVDQKTLGPIQVLGTWYDYKFGFIPDTHKDIIEYRHLKPRILTEEVATKWIFIDGYRGYISVRPGTPQNLALRVISSEETGDDKIKYYLTEDDITNTITLIKEILRYRLDEIYDKRMLALNLNVSDLEYSSWDQQKSEALAFTNDNASPTPLLSSLALARGITLDEMVTKVNSAIDAHTDALSNLLAAKQAAETEIKACQSIADCHRLMHNKFEISMSYAQQQEEGVDYAARFDL